MGKKKKNIYIVVHGRIPGVYNSWFGEDGAKKQVNDFPEAIYKGFYDKETALQWLKEFESETLLAYAPSLFQTAQEAKASDDSKNNLQADKVVIFTDGSALKNPGPGGYGTVLLYKKHRKELSGGYRETTNNRMELMACIKGLEVLKHKSEVVVYSDSKYVIDGMTKGWAKRWQKNGWMRSKKDRAENADLWAQLLKLCEQHNVEFCWVRGHAGNPENERCDRLAAEAAKMKNLPVDKVFNNEGSLPLFNTPPNR